MNGRILIFLMLFSIIFSCRNKDECNTCGIGRKKSVAELHLDSNMYRVAVQTQRYFEGGHESRFGITVPNDYVYSIINSFVSQRPLLSDSSICIVLYQNCYLKNFIEIYPENILAYSKYVFVSNNLTYTTYFKDDNNQFHKCQPSEEVKGISSDNHYKVLETFKDFSSKEKSFILFYNTNALLYFNKYTR